VSRKVIQVIPALWITAGATALPLVGVPVAYALIWSLEPLTDYIFDDLDLVTFVLVFLLLSVIHELIHAAGFVWVGGASPTSIGFTIHWRKLAPATYCHELVSASSFRAAAVAPLLVLGVLPAIYGLSTGSAAATFWSAFMISAAAGDIAILHATRSLPASHSMWVSPRPGPEEPVEAGPAPDQDPD
jgi:Putative zincin peptidase